MANASDESRISNIESPGSDRVLGFFWATIICRGDTYCSVYFHAFSILVEIFVKFILKIEMQENSFFNIKI